VTLQEKQGSERRAVVVCKRLSSLATRYRLQFNVMRSRPVALTSDEQWLVGLAWEMLQHEFRGMDEHGGIMDITCRIWIFS
jgi:hypothetical protein